MESTSGEKLVDAVETMQNDENDKNIEVGKQQRRQDSTSENNKIEITNLGRFVFGVSIYLRDELKN